MNRLKGIYLFTIFWAVSLLTDAQTTPYAELLNSDINVCSQTTITVVLQIKFYGNPPFGFNLKKPDGNIISETKKDIFAEDLIDGVYYYTHNLNFPVEAGTSKRTGSFEITEVFDSNTPDWSYGAGNPMTDVAVSFTNWAMPEPDAGQDIDSCGLTAILSAMPDAVSDSYSWETPAQGSISDLLKSDATFEGPEKNIYTLFFTQNNGTCTTRDTVIVNLLGSPSATLTTSSEVCGSESQPVSLDLTFGGENGPWDYQISDGSSSLINNTSATASSSVTTYVNGETIFKYEWVRDTNGCYARPTDIVGQASVTDLLPSANAGSDKIICGLDSEMEAIPDKGTGQWTTNASELLNITSPSDPNSVVTASQQGTYTLTWTENNKECSNSAQVDIQFVEYPTLTFQNFKDTICEGDEASFPFEVTGSNGPWVLTYSDNTSRQTFDFDNSISAFTAAPANSIVYSTISISDQYGCSSELNDQLSLTVDQMPTPHAGDDMAVCGKIVDLNATMSEIAQSGTWSVANGSFVDDDRTNPKAGFESNIWGEQTFTWTEVNGICSASDDVAVRFDEAPVADAGDDFTLYHQDRTQLHARSPVTSQADWLGEWYILSGSGNLTGTENKDAILSELRHGQTTLAWTVTNGVCPPESDTLAITVKGLTYYTGISPNEDGVNDYFKLKGAYTIPNNELIVFDQNGQVVFHQRNLEEDNQWNGTDMDGEPLKSGVYYFIFKGEGIEPIKDYIVIKRN